MKKTKAVKRKAAVILAAVIVFSSIGQCETLLAEEVSVSGADTVKTAESTENENSTEKTDTAEKEVVETENTEGSEMLECETTENIGSTGTEETVETEVSAVEGQESTVATETEDVEIECIETEMEDALKAADIDNTISNATNISIGTEITGTLDSISDVDYFKFTTDGTDSFYTFSFSNIDISEGITYYIYSDENELNKIAYDKYCYAKKTSTANLKKLEKNRTYYIKIFNGNGIGDYRFIVKKVEDDIKDTMAEALDITIGVEVNGRLDNRYDKDCFKVTTDNTDSFYTFTFSNVDVSGYACYYIYSDENELKRITYDGCSAKQTSTANLVKLEKNHTYYIKILNGEYDYGTGNYKFIINRIEDDIKDTMPEASDVACGTEICAKLDNRYDKDCFKVTTDNTDSFYTFTFSNVDVSGYAYYYIYSDENELNKIAYDSCSAKQTSTANLVKLEKNHTYYIKILNSEYNYGTGNYKFVIKNTKDDVADAVTFAKSLKLNETKKFALQNSKDVDCFKFTTTTYTNYTVNFTNVNSESAVYIRIYSGKDCLNNQLVLDKYLYKKQSLNSAYKELKLKTNKTYYVLISGSNIGNYKLGIDATGPASAIAKSASGKVTITWKKVAKATGYEVYRSVSRSGKYKKIETIKKNSTVKYTDSKGLKKGKTYYYKVRAYKKSGKKTYYSAYSAVKSVKAK